MNEWYPRFGSGEMGLHDLFFLCFSNCPTWGFCGTGTYYLTSHNQYDGTKTRLAKDVHCLAAFGEEGGIKYLPGRGEGFCDNNNTLTPRVFGIFGIIFLAVPGMSGGLEV